MNEVKEKLASVLPEGVTLPDEILEKVAGGLTSDATGEELLKALTDVGVNFGSVAVSKPDKGGLGGLAVN